VAARLNIRAKHGIAAPMLRRGALLLSFFLAGCAAGRVPEFAAKPYEPFTREDTVAIALREWRLFGSVVDDDQGEAAPTQKPERQPGLWQRVGAPFFDPTQKREQLTTAKLKQPANAVL